MKFIYLLLVLFISTNTMGNGPVYNFNFNNYKEDKDKKTDYNFDLKKNAPVGDVLKAISTERKPLPAVPEKTAGDNFRLRFGYNNTIDSSEIAYDDSFFDEGAFPESFNVSTTVHADLMLFLSKGFFITAGLQYSEGHLIYSAFKSSNTSETAPLEPEPTDGFGANSTVYNNYEQVFISEWSPRVGLGYELRLNENVRTFLAVDATKISAQVLTEFSNFDQPQDLSILRSRANLGVSYHAMKNVSLEIGLFYGLDSISGPVSLTNRSSGFTTGFSILI
jgi:hypothetical protein